MAKSHLTAFDADIIRTTFLKEVHESKLPKSEWQNLARRLVEAYTGQQEVDPQLVDWIVQGGT
ncbi:hypothetical protein EN858_05810 [Mesorhizobium sp. M4B.F.Ca.ET.215.01.1.1]|uniref:hypothetical protein n=1 Tax=unclassified Mesorhizobium TaxID=325217 RepID=UPI000FCB7124|nr:MULTISPECIES: hypothetical protein [unclassified Mesorhizobium]RVD45293.1 hypothetical protein EN741_05820 [Mesorhizobium sp. M4B.F.Ca.ET.019.03.1.1]RWF62658.1 MAG: hypothetical protein EOS47_22555 [Mesorhizobium sp.]TGQ15358.1 hypothetical protein EN858_05810 [Mesorhizobium sp. M4B.F.Ca.ET.215.01.1.1]TGQ48433.1 hypothetical protein EN863_004855 [Mesorhizobium sp. M00.F.Ca.ET.220.01.1.1]TGR00837.1 hypothetical protein EN843_31330 [Mesorhizobium sp. M4B.F.Ca.ET.200.01.1.1]